MTQKVHFNQPLKSPMWPVLTRPDIQWTPTVYLCPLHVFTGVMTLQMANGHRAVTVSKAQDVQCPCDLDTTRKERPLPAPDKGAKVGAGLRLT